MAKSKVIQVVFKLKDGVSAKLKGIGAGIKRLGAGIGKMVVASIAAFAALTAVLIKMGKVFAEQEQAENDLVAAFDNAGESGARLLPIFKEFASSIQRVTRFGDEGTLAIIAYGKNLGITTDKLQGATVAAIGLAKKYKIDVRTAMMLVGRAFLGQTQMLTRYGIVLDETLTVQEKFDALLKIGRKSFGLATRDVLKLTGRVIQLKNAFGDAIEQFFSGFFNIKNLTNFIKNLGRAIENMNKSGAVQEFGRKLGNMVGNAIRIFQLFADNKELRIELITKGFDALKSKIASVINDIAQSDTFKAIKQGFSDAISGGIVDGIEKAKSALKDEAKSLGKKLGFGPPDRTKADASGQEKPSIEGETKEELYRRRRNESARRQNKPVPFPNQSKKSAFDQIPKLDGSVVKLSPADVDAAINRALSAGGGAKTAELTESQKQTTLLKSISENVGGVK